jgi:hypothetical protein
LRLETERLVLRPLEPGDAEHVHAGDCGLQHLEGGTQVELGYRMGREYRGRGYTTDAARACMTYVGPGHHYGADAVVYEVRRAEAARGSPAG